MTCPLCLNQNTSLRHEYQDKNLGLRSFHQCLQCRLTFLSPEHHLNLEEEKKRYDLHKNDPSDEGYVQFLNQLLIPLRPFLTKDMQGLDYGCGPGPTISILLKEQGFDVQDYDPLYASDEKLLERTYDFITSTEVVEHFCKPRVEFEKLKAYLNPQGVLAVMTQMLEEGKEFKDWWYWSEPTHVCFYEPATFVWIAQWLDVSIIREEKNVIFFKKA